MVVVLITSFVFANISKESYADLSTIREQKEEAKKEREVNQAIADKLKNDIAGLEAQIESFQSALNYLQNKIEQKEKEIDETLKKIAKQENDLSKRLRATYEAGDTSALDVLFGSTSISDFIANLSFVQKIQQADIDLLSSLKKSKENLLKTKKELKEEQDKIKKLQRKNEKAQAKLIKKKGKVTRKIKDLDKYIKGLEEAERNILALLDGYDDSGVNVNGVSGYIWPVPSTHYTTDEFGAPRPGRRHKGLDIAGSSGSKIVSVADGKVVSAGWNGDYGQQVIVSHGSGIVSVYCHLSSISVHKDQKISAGKKVGGMGNTGRSFGTHLHFEIRVNGVQKNPRNYIGW